MQGIPYETFAVKKEYYSEDLCRTVVERTLISPHILDMRNTDLMATPQAKISAFVLAYQTIVDAVETSEKKSHAAGADDGYPLLLYFILKSQPLFVNSTTKFARGVV